MTDKTSRTDSIDVNESRFSFGKNWLDFVEHLDDARIAEAEESVRKLCGAERLDHQRLLDIGSGSGLFSLAARRLGATIYSFDYDEHSVVATQKLRDRFFASDPNWTVNQGSVLDPAYLSTLGTFDIVYSWGVLHHTGAMVQAITNAASCVKQNGLFVFALYRKTMLCNFWAHEKRWYAAARPISQKIARAIFIGTFRLAFLAKSRNFAAYVGGYRSNRGMSYWHDVHDWMGGYPYESISPEDTHALMTRLGFVQVRRNIRPYSIGVFGSGCDEYVYRRK